TPAQRSRLLEVRGATAHRISTFRFVDVLFNQRIAGLDDVTVRRAIQSAVDRDAILRGALEGSGGLPQTSAITDGLPWVAARLSPATPPQTNPSAALDAAGWTLDSNGLRARDGQELNFSLSVADADPLPKVARELAQQLAAIGIGVH